MTKVIKDMNTALEEARIKGKQLENSIDGKIRELNQNIQTELEERIEKIPKFYNQKIENLRNDLDKCIKTTKNL
jgi:F0F1-type ATP synthase membrane subunit b/b'